MHTVAEVHAEQFVEQTMQEPFDKYLPVAQVKQEFVLISLHVKHEVSHWTHNLGEFPIKR